MVMNTSLVLCVAQVVPFTNHAFWRQASRRSPIDRFRACSSKLKVVMHLLLKVSNADAATGSNTNGNQNQHSNGTSFVLAILYFLCVALNRNT